MEHELKAMHVMVCLNCPCKAKTKHDVQIYFDPDVRYKYSSLIYSVFRKNYVFSQFTATFPSPTFKALNEREFTFTPIG